jgi:Mn2+/Fe2+ NRAMP family transporter
VEEKWTEENLGPNRITAVLGMGFGSVIGLSVIVAAGLVFHPRGIQVDAYEQVALLFSLPLGRIGYWLFAAGLFVACFGAALELSLDIAYVHAQAFGWKWGENERPADAARFSMVFTIFLALASVFILAGVDPLKLTLFSMAVTAVILPVVVLPFLVLMNDKKFVGSHTNGPVGNAVVFFCIVLASLLALVAIPLEIFGGK